MLAWLSAWSEEQTCIWPSWCHCHSLSLASVKSRLVLHFWYRFTRLVPEKGPLNECVCISQDTDLCRSWNKYIEFKRTVSCDQWRRHGGRGKLPPYGWTSKNYVICVCFHCHGTSSYHTTNTLQDRRAKSHVDTQTIQPGLGDFVL